MKIFNKEKGKKALIKIEEILVSEIRDIEEETGKSYEVLIGDDGDTDIFMCINLDDYFKGDCWIGEIPTDINWRNPKEIKKDLDKIKKEIEDKYEEHIKMLDEISND